MLRALFTAARPRVPHSAGPPLPRHPTPSVRRPAAPQPPHPPPPPPPRGPPPLAAPPLPRARPCLCERRPLAGSRPGAGPPAEPGHRPDWEMDWPALLYAPVGLPGRRPVGLLIVGARTGHWYHQQEIDY